jgi:acyl-CoA synthetase (AMP-forming)/AMP-acid ligase II
VRAIPTELVERYETEGWWTRDTIGELLARGLDAAPDTRFRVHSDVRPWSGTFRDVERTARRLAQGLRERGVRRGEVIAFQLPNWMEAAAVFWASAFLGAVVVPIVHYYGRKELGFILDAVRPRVFITAERFHRMEHHPDLTAQVPVVGVVGRDFEELLSDDLLEGTERPDPDSPAVYAFTSGTTSSPKGVVHSHRTLVCETRQITDRFPPDMEQQLVTAPVGHFIGMVTAFLVPVLEASTLDLTDVWDPGRALRLMASDGITVGGGPPYYLTSLLDHPDFSPDRHLPHMRYAGLGGAAVPTAVTTRLSELGITVHRSYGSTEHPSMTASLHTAPEDKRLRTDGAALPGVELRLAPDGEILSRGPDLCLGYTDPALTAQAFDEDGWYHTGDIGVLDEDGYLTIADRKADFIIRGGENISASEVEEELLTLDGVAEAAVVAAPDARLGEHAVAVLRLRPGGVLPTLDAMRAHLSRAGLARQKWPEEVFGVEEFPRTASGKIQKFRLRQDLTVRRDDA